MAFWGDHLKATDGITTPSDSDCGGGRLGDVVVGGIRGVKTVVVGLAAVVGTAMVVVVVEIGSEVVAALVVGVVAPYRQRCWVIEVLLFRASPWLFTRGQ